MERNTLIKDHVNQLKEVDEKRYNEMMAALALMGDHSYFTRMVCGNPEKPLDKIKIKVVEVMKTFLGFTQDDFLNNSVPELKLETA